MKRILAVLALGAAAILVSKCGPSQEAPGSGAATPAAAKPPFGFLNTPAEGQVVKPLTFVSGWALADSGIAEVSVIFDDGQKGYVKVGDPFGGVKEKYPNYPDSDKAGYIFAIPKMTSGPHSLTVTIRARDGSTMQVQRHFSIP